MKSKRSEDSYHNPTWLREYYLEKNLSCAEIGAMFGVSHKFVHKYVVKFGLIKSRELRIQARRRVLPRLYQDRNWLYQKYILENLSLQSIAELNSTTRHAIHTYVKEFKFIKSKDTKEAAKYTTIKSRYEQIIRHDYLENRQSALEIAQKYGLNKKTIRRWVNRLGLKRENEEIYSLQQKKARVTNLARYGVDSVLKLPKYQALTKQSKIRNRNRGTDFRKSHAEDKCFRYIQQHIDPDARQEVFHCGFHIDFYLPRYDIFIQFDGDYWHGRLLPKPESSQYTAILKNVERDKIQIIRIPNLVRVWESEFKRDPMILMSKIEAQRAA